MKLDCLADNMTSQPTERSDYEFQCYQLLSRPRENIRKYNQSQEDNANEKDAHSGEGNTNNLVKLHTIQLPNSHVLMKIG